MILRCPPDKVDLLARERWFWERAADSMNKAMKCLEESYTWDEFPDFFHIHVENWKLWTLDANELRKRRMGADPGRSTWDILNRRNKEDKWKHNLEPKVIRPKRKA